MNSKRNEPRALARAVMRTRMAVPTLWACLAIVVGCSQLDPQPTAEQPERFPEAGRNLVMERLNESDGFLLEKRLSAGDAHMGRWILPDPLQNLI